MKNWKFILWSSLLGLLLLAACNTDTNSAVALDIPEHLDIRLDGVQYGIEGVRKGKWNNGVAPKPTPSLCLTFERTNGKEAFKECLSHKQLGQAIKEVDGLIALFSDSLALYKQYLDPKTGTLAAQGKFAKMATIHRLGIETEMLRTTNDNFMIFPFLHFKTFGKVHIDDRVPLRNMKSLVRLQEIFVLAKAKIAADNPGIK